MKSSEELAEAIRSVGGAILPRTVGGGHDASGGYVASLTEAVMGVTAGLVQIADALRDVAEAIRETRGDSE